MASVNGVAGNPPNTLTILGCGTLGSAILFGLLASSAEKSKKVENGVIDQVQEAHLLNGFDHEAPEKHENIQKPSRILACVRTEQSAEGLRKQLPIFEHALPVNVIRGDNSRAVQAADTVLLGCQPKDLDSCLGAPGVERALRGKLLISILAGVTIPQIEEVLARGETKATVKTNGDSTTAENSRTTSIIRAMPNTASFVRASTTVITACSIATPSNLRLVEWLFTCIGTVTHITAAQFDACTALCGSTPAFFALFIESLLDGAVALGLKRSEAQIMAAQTMKGAATLMLAGEQPETLKEKVATPGGSTIQGLVELERKALRGTVADALIRCTAAASTLGSKQA
ncbi:MAG: hypothetical protein L6R38_005412 [Xanthoria sp. 2 TBL-2021]|nr:MAG: hypothetical protein L6R38_005412 [Xanthoria sp. 2 TBL-2021]